MSVPGLAMAILALSLERQGLVVQLLAQSEWLHPGCSMDVAVACRSDRDTMAASVNSQVVSACFRTDLGSSLTVANG